MHSNACARSVIRKQACSLGPQRSDSEAISERVAAIPLFNFGSALYGRVVPHSISQSATAARQTVANQDRGAPAEHEEYPINYCYLKPTNCKQESQANFVGVVRRQVCYLHQINAINYPALRRSS